MRWTVHGRRQLYTSEWLSVWLDDVEVPGGERFEHHVVRVSRPSVAVVVTDEQDRVLMLWRHRFITDAWGWEIPAGWTGDDESPVDAARREVEEETGWRPGLLTELCSYHPLDGLSDLSLVLFRANGATYTGQPADRSEASRVEWISLNEVQRLLTDGSLRDGPTLTALSLVLAFPDQHAP